MPENTLSSHRAFIGLGSNLEPRRAYLDLAIRELSTVGEIVRISSIYQTAPVGGIPQPDYLNAVLELRTPVGPLELAASMKTFEKKIGRISRPRWHEREVDLDLLFYDDLVLESSELTVPHPEIARRAFVLVPIAELDPMLEHPVLHKTVAELRDAVGTFGVTKTDFAPTST